FGKLRQIAGAVSGLILDQQRRVDFRVTKLARVQIKNEAADGALKAGQCTFQHDEAGARNLLRRLEVHQTQCFADLEMLLRCEIKLSRRSYLSSLDVALFICAVRHIGARQVRDDLERLPDLSIELALVVLALRNPIFELGNLTHQVRHRRVVFRRLSLADLFRGGIAARLGILKSRQAGPALVVEGYDFGRLRLEPAPLQALVESIGVVSDPFDVKHGEGLDRAGATLPASIGRQIAVVQPRWPRVSHLINSELAIKGNSSNLRGRRRLRLTLLDEL